MGAGRYLGEWGQGRGASPLAGWGTQPPVYWREKIQYKQMRGRGQEMEAVRVSVFSPQRGGFSRIPRPIHPHCPFCSSPLLFCHKCELFVIIDKGWWWCGMRKLTQS